MSRVPKVTYATLHGMGIHEISLINFRNLKNKKIKFSEGITVVVGDNATGKTNILEALYLLSSGKSFRARVEEEMVNYDAEIARVSGVASGGKLAVVLTRGVITVGKVTEKTQRKKLLVNGVPRRLVDFSGILKTVAFRPQDMDIVTESPAIRRRFLDGILSQVDAQYRRAILSYEKGLRRRNRVLLSIRDEGMPRRNLYFWDKLLIKNGDYIMRKREDLIYFLNNSAQLNESVYRIEYDRSAISEERLRQYEKEEVYAATTLVGPHRDDIVFIKNDHELARYGSRGEQRIAVLWAKIAELNYIERETGERPLLLLDDIFSELDHEHRALVNKTAAQGQTVITTADPHYISFGKGKFEKIEL